MYKLNLEKTEEPKIKLSVFIYHRESKGNPGKKKKDTYYFFIDYTKAFLCVDHNTLWKILKEMGTADHLTCLLRNLYSGQEATVRTECGTTIFSKLGKEYVKTVYCHPAYLTSHGMLGWMNHKLESRLPGEISTTSAMQMIPVCTSSSMAFHTMYSTYKLNKHIDNIQLVIVLS